MRSIGFLAGLLIVFSGSGNAAPLSAHQLALPVVGMRVADLRDTFHEARGGSKQDPAREHGATDILAPRGTPVVAVEDGTIQKLFHSKAGGNTIYLFDSHKEYCFYYAHLDHYDPSISEGTHVHRGEVIGYVGTTGNAPPNTPHLHFGISEIGPDKKWWGGTPINPYPYLRAAALRFGSRG
jgi:murein DD-endopeptidase MepM/ murein hydrolase activator NlpD